MVAINNWSKDRLKIESYKDGKKAGWRVSATLPGGGRIRKRFSAKAEAEMEVSRFPKGASPYGCLDMLGNQYEWTRDLNDPYPGNPQAERMKDYAGKMVVLRGGS